MLLIQYEKRFYCKRGGYQNFQYQFHALFHENEPLAKRKYNENFVVPMGCCDGAKVFELGWQFIVLLNLILHLTRKVLVFIEAMDLSRRWTYEFSGTYRVEI